MSNVYFLNAHTPMRKAPSVYGDGNAIVVLQIGKNGADLIAVIRNGRFIYDGIAIFGGDRKDGRVFIDTTAPCDGKPRCSRRMHRGESHGDTTGVIHFADITEIGIRRCIGSDGQRAVQRPQIEFIGRIFGIFGRVIEGADGIRNIGFISTRDGGAFLYPCLGNRTIDLDMRFREQESLLYVPPSVRYGNHTYTSTKAIEQPVYPITAPVCGSLRHIPAFRSPTYMVRVSRRLVT